MGRSDSFSADPEVNPTKAATERIEATAAT
jgi:hypothetical protein